MNTNKTKISNHQLLALVANFAMGTTIMSVSGVAGLAKQDAWICAIIAPLVGLAFIWMYYNLGVLYPGKTFVEILKCALGKWIGSIIAAGFVLFVCFLDCAQVIFFVGNFVKVEFMTETPIYALNFLIAAALVIGIYYGLEAIARSAEVFIIIVISLILIALLLNIPNIRINYMLPIMEDGIAPAFKGTLYLSSYMTWSLIALNMVFPVSVAQDSKTRNSMFLGYLLGAAVNFLITIMSILVLGGTISAKDKYPIHLLAQQVNIGIITRIEGVVSCAWIITQFLKALLYFYAGLIGFSQLFGLKDYKKLICPLALVMLVFSGVVYPNVAYQAKWDSETWIPFIGSFGAVLPIILIMISIIKSFISRIKNTVSQSS